VAESDLSGNAKSEYVFFNGERVARKDFPGNTISYYFSDQLKTASVITDSAGNIKEDEDYYPWGGELQFVNSDSNHYKYGGHERDSETGLDYMLARYYSNPLGRFLTPDWAGHPTEVPYANFGNPQSLNLYSYTKNNPTTFGDPDGHCCLEELEHIAQEAEQLAVDKVVKPLVESAVGEAEVAGRVALSTVGTVVLAATYLISPGTGSSGKNSEVEWELNNMAKQQRQQQQLGQGRGAGEEQSQSDDARDRSRTNGGLVKPNRGPGSVPKDQRDPKRTATDKDKAKMRAEQKGNCAHCGKPLGDEKGIGHHYPVRHADGGSEMKLVHKKCHDQLHSCN
jgi:RHS repeat-associated protein